MIHCWMCIETIKKKKQNRERESEREQQQDFVAFSNIT